jgi:hypothetical protein
MTIYLNDDFEGANFNLWTNTQVGGAGNYATIQSTIVNSGTFAAAFAINANEYAYAQKTLGTLSSCCVRSYINLPVLPSVGTYFRILFLGTAEDDLVGIIIINISGVYYICDNSNYFTSTYTEIAITPNTQHAIEIDVSGLTTASGNAKVYFDGSLTNNDNTNLSTFSGINNFICGNYFSSSGGTVYVDNVVVSDSYIGLYNPISFALTSITADVNSIIRTGANTITFTVAGTDSVNLSASSYTCYLYFRNNNTITPYTIGPYTADVTKLSANTFTATLHWNPESPVELHTYDIKAIVQKTS